MSPRPAWPKRNGTRLLADLSPLRESRDFRLLFIGGGVSHLGRQLTVVAIPYQVFLITGSSLAVGMGIATLIFLALGRRRSTSP